MEKEWNEKIVYEKGTEIKWMNVLPLTIQLIILQLIYYDALHPSPYIHHVVMSRLWKLIN